MLEKTNLDNKFPPLDLSELKSRSSLEMVPNDIKPLADDITGIAEEVYGDWVAINWHGSIPRGDFVWGESDADFSIITKIEPTMEQKEIRNKMLDDIVPKWIGLGVAKLDVIALGIEEIHNDSRRNGMFFCYTDGINLPGSQELNLEFVLPKDRKELVNLLNRYFELWVKTVREKNTYEPSEVQQVRKRTIRAIYADAFLEGAPYERSWKKYGDNIKIYAPGWLEKYNLLLDGSFEIDELMGIASEIVNQLKARGMEFETSWG